VITAPLAWLGVVVVAQGGVPSPPNPKGKSLDQKLVGVWTTKFTSQVNEITYLANHTYIRKWGRDKFTTGFYQEKGRWETLRGDRVQWIPESRKNQVSRSDRKLTAEVRALEKAMDEGAWKPLPKRIVFTGNDAFSEFKGFGDSKQSNHYVRVKRRP